MRGIGKRKQLFAYISILLTIVTYSYIYARELALPERILFGDCQNLQVDQPDTIPTRTITKNSEQKKWTFIVYMAADNDLWSFAARNIKEMAHIGSNEHINIVVHLDIRMVGNKKVTRRYYVEKNKITLMNNTNNSAMNSGDPKTLISCCAWAMNSYPAQHYALILWNHGTGIIDPGHSRIINPATLFTFNPFINKYELDRTIGFIDLISQRGICWDDSTGHYLTNYKLDLALKTIRNEILNGGKISIIGFDACLMSMLEVANIAKNYADIKVSSQEVELGTGWNYRKVLAPFAKKSLTPTTFAQHIVTVYEQTYRNITNDYTQSALALDGINTLENNVNTVAQLLTQALKKQQRHSVKNAIKSSRNKLLCTHFDEPTYIDLDHLYNNLSNNLNKFALNDNQDDIQIKQALKIALDEGRAMINNTVIANVVGKNLRKAKGISIYFPDRRMHTSYKKTIFAKENSWLKFLNTYLQT